MPGKLPQRKLVTTAAAGYSSYGNQIGLATGQVDEIYHPGYVAKRMELSLIHISLRPVYGVLPMALAAAENGTHALYVPAENAAEAAEACADTVSYTHLPCQDPDCWKAAAHSPRL